MNVFPITPEVKEAVARVVEYATHEDHWYRPERGDAPPGDKTEHEVIIGNTRSVFSWTEHPEQGVYRHLSVSVAGGKWPHPIVVWTLAHMFGFTGAEELADTGVVRDRAEGWGVDVNDEEQCIVVIERVRTEEGAIAGPSA